MSYRKAEQVAQILRARILSGELSPGSRLPSYDELREQFDISRPTVARMLATLRAEGLLSARGGRSVLVAEQLPHHHRYLWVTSEQPGSLHWTRFLETFVELIDQGGTGLPGQVEALLGVDGRSNNPAYQRLSETIRQGSAAGLILVNSATMYQLPSLQAEGLPRVAIGAGLPHAALVSLAFDQLFERACSHLFEHGKRLAIMSPHEQSLRAIAACLRSKGVDDSQVRALHVATPGCERITQLLFERSDRPDALFITDDNLVEPVLVGLQRAHCSPHDIHVLSHCNWPHPLGQAEGVQHVGFDVREIFGAARGCFDALRGGATPQAAAISPRFLAELTAPLG